jgi:hypothetical protein
MTPFNFGWIDDPESVEAVCASMEQPLFAEAAAHLLVGNGPEEVFLWRACRQVLGGLLPPRHQGRVGSCVAFGTASAVEHLQCVEIVAGEREGYQDLAHEVIYAGSRVEVGGGKVRGDGSVGAWAAQFVQRWGVVARGRFGPHDLAAYDEQRCREWGQSGVPDDLEPEARRHPVRQAARVRTWDEARAALSNGYPITVCSRVGFDRQRRDQDGFVKPRGQWAHCMALIGFVNGQRPGGFLLNSWGQSPTLLPPDETGPVGLGDHSAAGFWADAEVIDAMLKQGDSWAFSAFAGFPPQHLSWLI